MDKALNVIKGDAEFKGIAISVVGALIALLTIRGFCFEHPNFPSAPTLTILGGW